MTRQSLSPGSASPCLNCGDPSDELFCGACREMGCSIPPPSRPSAGSRDALVFKISAALAEGKDSGGYDTLLDMYAHIALKVMEANGAAQSSGEPK